VLSELAKATMEEGEKYSILRISKIFEGKIFGKRVITKSELTETKQRKTIRTPKILNNG
jgi:hypothetical protein